MGKSLTKVVYKPDHTSNQEYIVIVNPEEYKKWKAGDTSIALSEVVDSFTVFYSTQGHQGLLGQASKQQLENDFGTSKDIDVVAAILENGKDQAGEGIGALSGVANTNITRGRVTSSDIKGNISRGPSA